MREPPRLPPSSPSSLSSSSRPKRFSQKLQNYPPSWDLCLHLPLCLCLGVGCTGQNERGPGVHSPEMPCFNIRQRSHQHPRASSPGGGGENLDPSGFLPKFPVDLCTAEGNLSLFAGLYACLWTLTYHHLFGAVDLFPFMLYSML